MKIGVWLGSEIVPSVGGAASYMVRLIRSIDNFTFSESIEICFISIVPQKGFNKEIVNISQFPSVFYAFFSFSKKTKNILRRVDEFLVRRKGLNKILKKDNVKIIYYLSQTNCFDPSFPFIATNWDIGHRSTHAYPEFVSGNNFEYRDSFYQEVLPKALLIICESESGKQELADYTKIGLHKIRVMPIFSGTVSTLCVSEERMAMILGELGVKRYCFFYYPAQFWAHKNHYGLLKAFKAFVDKGNTNIKLVLSGSNAGNVEYVKNLIQDYNLENFVVLLGFVSEEFVYTLYKNALCLVMASHFGPTNMPPIEAMEIGCPVACSDLGGHREILGDNAVYFDSYDCDSILNALNEMNCHRQMYLERVERQRGLTIYRIDNSMNCLNTILSEAVRIRMNWG